MDAYQQPHRYMRPPPPPPPSTADPYYHHQQQQQQQQPSQRAPPVPQQGPWYSNQFQYHPPSSHSPSPPPPPPPQQQQQQSQWAPQPPPPHHSDHSAYPPPPLPYPTHPHPNNNNHFPPPPPPTPPPPPPPPSHVPHSQIPQAYPNQEWANPNWSHHQGWDYSGHNNVEDWAARAREWAAAKAAMDDQHPPPQSQFTPVGRSEEQSRFHDQYPQAVNSHYPASSYQQYPPPHRPPMVFPQETAASVGSGPPSYVPDGHLPYTVLAGETNTGFSHQETFPTSPYVHQQEVPSSYSSVTGKEETAEKEQMYTSFPFSTSAQDVQYHVQPSQPAVGRSVLSEQPFAYGNQAADPTTDLSDQPLDFAPRFNRDHDPHMQSSYAAHHDPAGTVRGIDPVAALPSINSWTPPAAPGVIYPPISAVPPSGPQHDPSLVVPPVSGHAVPPFGRFPGPSFQPTIPSAGAPYGLGAGPTVHPTTAFPGDTYGVSTVSERPKKAAMPNWLKEEIIKNKAIISKSSLEHPKEETQSIEDDGVDKSIGKGDQADSKSIDSSRSTEEEDDDEDYVEAARNAAINQEIKRVLTEVLLKVTDELFDEIATKVLSEDDLTVEVDHNIVSSSHNASAVPTSKASAKVLVPVKAKESETGGVSEKSSSSSPGDVLGLANYASDEDGDGEIQSSSMQNSREIVVPQQSSIKKLPEDMHDATENGRSQVELEEHSRGQTNLESDGDQSDDINVGGKMLDGDNGLGSKDKLGEKVILKTELPGENVSVKSTMDDSQGQDTRVKSDKNDQHENRRSSSGKDFVKEVESSRKRADEKGDENRRRQDERHLRKEKTDDRNGSKERMKVQGLKPGEQVNESESRRRSTHLDVKEDRKDTERLQRASGKEDTDRKRERAKDREEDRSRHKLTSDSSKHKRRRSPSISSRDRNSKDNSVSHANDSSDEASDDSKRKLRSRKRNLSPSPLRSRRRQVSRSPHSKHSQRRHSPYSSLETTRGKRSRSRSPVRRQR